MGFPGSSAGKKSTCNAGDPFDSSVGEIPWRRDRLPIPVFWPGEFHGLFSPWGHRESDTTERLSLHFTSIFLRNAEVITETLQIFFFLVCEIKLKRANFLGQCIWGAFLDYYTGILYYSCKESKLHDGNTFVPI